MENANWKSYLTNRIQGQEKNVPWFFHDKIKCNRFCIENNINTANIYHIFEDADQISFDSVNKMEFILKPTLESSTKGVMVLRRVDRGYYDSLSKKNYTFDEIIDIQRDLFIKNTNKANRIILEEKIYDEDDSYRIPRDFKFYTFNGKIAAILQINRNVKPSAVTWYNSNFELMDEGIIWSNPKYVNLINENTRPENWCEMLELVTYISQLAKTPFASIDMYSSDRGAILGEITLAPGGLYHGEHYLLSEQENRNWGSYWRKSLQELG